MIEHVRRIAEQYEYDAIEEAMILHMVNHTNSIFVDESSEIETINTLAKASVVRKYLDEGLTMQEAIRELGRKIRKLTGGHNGI